MQRLQLVIAALTLACIGAPARGQVPETPEAAARMLIDAMFRADDAGVRTLIDDALPPGHEGLAADPEIDLMRVWNGRLKPPYAIDVAVIEQDSSRALLAVQASASGPVAGLEGNRRLRVGAVSPVAAVRVGGRWIPFLPLRRDRGGWFRFDNVGALRALAALNFVSDSLGGRWERDLSPERAEQLVRLNELAEGGWLSGLSTRLSADQPTLSEGVVVVAVEFSVGVRNPLGSVLHQEVASLPIRLRESGTPGFWTVDESAVDALAPLIEYGERRRASNGLLWQPMERQRIAREGEPATPEQRVFEELRAATRISVAEALETCGGVRLAMTMSTPQGLVGSPERLRRRVRDAIEGAGIRVDEDSLMTLHIDIQSRQLSWSGGPHNQRGEQFATMCEASLLMGAMVLGPDDCFGAASVRLASSRVTHAQDSLTMDAVAAYAIEAVERLVASARASTVVSAEGHDISRVDAARAAGVVRSLADAALAERAERPNPLLGSDLSVSSFVAPVLELRGAAFFPDIANENAIRTRLMGALRSEGFTIRPERGGPDAFPRLIYSATIDWSTYSYRGLFESASLLEDSCYLLVDDQWRVATGDVFTWKNTTIIEDRIGDALDQFESSFSTIADELAERRGR